MTPALWIAAAIGAIVFIVLPLSYRSAADDAKKAHEWGQ
jgi:predicted secreted protein